MYDFLFKHLKSFHFQTILTPSVKTVFLHLFSTLKSILVKDCDKFCIQKFLPSIQEHKLKPNIIMVDYAESTIAKQIIDLNSHLL